MKHYGDPCIHCKNPHDDVERGDCTGSKDNAIVLKYWVKKMAYEQSNGADLVRAKLSTGEIIEEGCFPQMHWWRNGKYKDAEVVSRGSF